METGYPCLDLSFSTSLSQFSVHLYIKLVVSFFNQPLNTLVKFVNERQKGKKAYCTRDHRRRKDISTAAAPASKNTIRALHNLNLNFPFRN